MATTDKWIGTTSADWGASAANWSTGFPTSNSNVVINTANILTISFGGGDNFVVNTLTVGNDFFAMNGGSLTVLGAASFAKDFTQTGGTLSAGGAVTISGTGRLIGGGAEGKTAFTISGTTALSGYTLGGSVVLNNAKTTNETGQITLGDNTGVGATINNKTGATFNIGGDFGIGLGAGTASFVNAGTLAKTGGSGTSFVDVNLNDTGVVTVAGGSLEFRGPNNSFTGAISGAGQFVIGSFVPSRDTIGGAASITTAGFVISDNGTVVTLAKNLGYTGNFTVTNNATLNLGRFTLTVSGGVNFANNAVIDGGGVLATRAGSDVGVGNFVLGGTVNWQNSGAVGEAGQFFLGDGSAHAATFTNEKGGVYNFTNDNGILVGAAANSRFVNLAGAMLEKTGGSGTSTILADVADTGAIIVASGAIELAGPVNTIAGAVSGAGEFALGNHGSDTISGAATITAATFLITDNGTQVTLAKNLSYAHNLVLQNNATLDVGASTLTLSGVDTFAGNVTLDGSGTLVTTAASSTGVTGLTLGGEVDWQNAGTVGNAGGMTIGDATFNTATFTNEKGGVYNFTNDNGIGVGTALDSSFVNLVGATLEKTGGSGTSIIFADVADTGAVKINTGTIEFAGIGNSFAGTISGAGQLFLGRGGSDLIAPGAAITAAAFAISDGGTRVTLGENLAYAGAFTLENGATLDLGGFTLTLSGTGTFVNNVATGGVGTLVTAHGHSIGISNGFTLGGAVDWQNAGTVNVLGGLTIGDPSFDAATFTNKNGGVYDFLNDSSIGIGAMPNSSFVNLAGAILEKTGGTGDSVIAVPVVNSGAVTVASGRMEFASTVGGAGSFTLKPGTVLQFDGSVAAGGNIHFFNKSGGDLLLLDGPQFGGAIHGFGGTNTDEIDVRDVNFTNPGFKLAYSGNATQGVLTLMDGINTAHLTMFGSYTKASFHAAADGFGGTQIFDPPVPHATLAVGSV